MNKDDLIKRRQLIEEAFNKSGQVQADALAEQHRLQGEYRLVSQLIEDIEKRENEDKPAKEEK